ncbi:hypothetical protein [Microbulbifer discodermiae]|uniref:hypothetical protein n=1 Tax=Microbulbifer sp. 2201CG32-9 TaxID=3232309 RepID=UPI00345BDA43
MSNKLLTQLIMLVLSGLMLILSSFTLAENYYEYCPIDPGDDQNFTIEEIHNPIFQQFDRKVEVFGIPIYAVRQVEDERLLHAANVMAQYLDNNENGAIDNPEVHEAMLDNGAFMVMWKDESDLDHLEVPQGMLGQDLGNDETRPEWHSSGHTGRFDASLEEVWHIISHAGYAYAYPEIFFETPGSQLSRAMDIARGGFFEEVPDPYPVGAWYTYDDQTCDYECMVTEYFYWGLTSLLGAQEHRQTEIYAEWKLNTPVLLKEVDISFYKLLTNKEYRLPMRLPDGKYRPAEEYCWYTY